MTILLVFFVFALLLFIACVIYYPDVYVWVEKKVAEIKTAWNNRKNPPTTPTAKT